MTQPRQPLCDSPKVLHVITRMNLGGPALDLLVLTHGLAARGYRSILVAGTCEAAAGDVPIEMPDEREITTVPTLSRSISPFRDITSLWAVYRIIRRHRPVVVHTHTAKAGLVGRVAGRLAGVPVIVHTFHGNSLSGYFPPFANACLRAVERQLARLTSGICVISNQQLEELSGALRIAPRGKFVVIPVGFDLSKELELPVPRPSGTLNVGWLGRLVPIKGVELLAGIVDEAARRNLPVRFLIGGDGPERGIIERCISRNGPDRVKWTGWERNVPRFLAECDILIQTSRNEGTPVALIQGMAAGRAFVSTPAGGVVDLVAGPESGGPHCRWFRNGVLAQPDAAAFTGAFERLLREPSAVADMGTAARSFAADRFRAERLVADTDAFYRELLASHAVSKGRHVEASAKPGGLCARETET